MGSRLRTLARVHLAALAGAGILALGDVAYANGWEGSAALGTDQWLRPEMSGQGFLVFDLRGNGYVGGGDFHLYYNTETVQVGVERVPLAGRRLELAAGVRAEGAIAGVLRNYSQNGARVPERGFFASYLLAFASLKWLPADAHSVELVATGRRWHFARETDVTSNDLLMPPDAWVFEPRLRYTFWRITSPGDEWRVDALQPRVVGFAAGVELGVDVRSDASAWGSIRNGNSGANMRNRPGDVILMARQWIRAGVQLHRALRLQVEQSASWGQGEDDLTRNRVGGMNPYVVPVPGLPWPALLSERLVAAQVSLHWKPWARRAHEFGVAVAGGLFNDVHRVGALDEFGGAGGAALFTDLRFGILHFHVRGGYGFPAPWLPNPPHVSVLGMVGVRLF